MWIFLTEHQYRESQGDTTMATKTKPSDVTAGGGSSDETPSCLQRFSNTVTGGLEDGFARLVCRMLWVCRLSYVLLMSHVCS